MKTPGKRETAGQNNRTRKRIEDNKQQKNNKKQKLFPTEEKSVYFTHWLCMSFPVSLTCGRLDPVQY